MAVENNILITGWGVVSPIGLSPEAYYQSLIAGRVGVKVREDLAGSGLPFSLGATIDDFDGRQFIKPRKAIKVMCRPIQFGFAVAWMAAERAGLFSSPIDPNRLGVVFGAETFFADPVEMAKAFAVCLRDGRFVHELWGQNAMAEIPPLWMLQYLANMIASHISIVLDARGPSNTICQGSISSSLAIIEGAELLRRGWANALVVGGASSQTMLTGMVYRGDKHLSRSLENPTGACRPFDRRRDGIVLGEGGGALVIETADQAQARSAVPLARLRGWANGFVRGNRAAQVKRIIEVAECALHRANISAGELDHVNATGCSAVDEDQTEAEVIRALCGDTPVVGLKANLGSLGPGSDVVELIGSLMALNQGELPGAPNPFQPDPLCRVNLNERRRPVERPHALKLSICPTGQISALVVSRIDSDVQTA